MRIPLMSPTHSDSCRPHISIFIVHKKSSAATRRDVRTKIAAIKANKSSEPMNNSHTQPGSSGVRGMCARPNVPLLVENFVRGQFAFVLSCFG
jgi:hypothetical protein